MKLQSTHGALPTSAILSSLMDIPEADDAKINITGLFIIALQFSAMIGACGLLHSVMT